MRIALQLQNIAINDEMTDRLIETFDRVQELKGNFSVDDAVAIQYYMDKKFAKKKVVSK